MKNLLTSLVLMTVFSSSAFAIDQVILKSGAIVEGKVLSDVPNRHVDIQLLNGNKQRFQQTEVASIERDVPSNKDSDSFGSESRAYLGIQGGLLLNTDSSSDNSKFSYGARFGVNAGQMGDFAKFAVGLSFTRFTESTALADGSYNELMAQFLFRKVANSGFFFGPEFGPVFVSASAGAISASKTYFQAGAVLGYDYYVNSGFSFGPIVQYDHLFSSPGALNNMKFLLAFTLHL